MSATESQLARRHDRGILSDWIGDDLLSWPSRMSDFFASPFERSDLAMPRTKDLGLPSMARLRMDVTENDENVTVTADLPGVTREDIDVHIDDGNMLTVEAKRERAEEEKNDKVHRRERHFGCVSRSIVLPETTNTEDCHADFANGTLTLRFGKTEARPARRRIAL